MDERVSDYLPEDLGMFYLYEDVDVSSSRELSTFFDKMSTLSPKANITLNINSRGGDVYSGMSMYTTVARSKNPVTTHIRGMCASAATWPAVAGDVRVMDRHSMMIVHQASTYMEGKYHEMKAAQAEDDWIYNTMLGIYTKHSTLSRKQVKDILLPASDVFLTAKDAKKYGLIDKIVGQL